jgi:peptidoglycan/xylan/chitin deacetylase (PgdA/CDA1 family)
MRDGRRVTITFDNGPDATVTAKVLDELAARGVKSTFFVVGEQLRQPGGRALVQRAVEEGHWIGNHTLTHTTPLGELADPAEVVREIEATQTLIGSLVHPDRLFRPFGSGGTIDERLLGAVALDHLRHGGYTCVLWNCVPRDWDDPSGWVDTALSEIATRPWTVVVVHDLPTGAMKRLPAFLDRLAEMGSEIVQNFPDDCVPLRRGVDTPASAQLFPSLQRIGGQR